MEVIGTDPYLSDSAFEERGIERVGFENPSSARTASVSTAS